MTNKKNVDKKIQPLKGALEFTSKDENKKLDEANILLITGLQDFKNNIEIIKQKNSDNSQYM